MRKLLSVTTLTFAALASATCLLGTAGPAAADAYCSRDTFYILSCGFETLAQCKATARECLPNPFQQPSNAYAYAPKAVKNLRK